ncbi:MAG TPA: ABC transporter ATP-binding protein [Gemmataceae bacterium]|jgi:putative ABC transport system ATP-binding protein|nr:ABC transporter ATP-binding protein [Gemmataceae bacterium]
MPAIAPLAPAKKVTDGRTSRKPSPTLEAINLVRGFGQGEMRTLAVNDVSMRLFPGEMALLMGPSGSGKSTLLAMVSGLLRPDEGKVIAHGEEMWIHSPVELERFRLKHCSYIFQGCNLFPALSARQQVEMVLRWGEGASSREARERAETVLIHLGLEKKMHLRPAQMSGGEKQRCAIARALVKNPSFLFADEPTSALDWENGEQVIDLLHKSAHERGSMVLVVTHDQRLIEYADRLFHMEDGKLTSDEKPNSRHIPNRPPVLTVPPAIAQARRLCLNKLQESTL